MCNFVVLVSLVAAICAVGSHAASYNCSQPPNFGNFDVNSCCRIPEINLGSAPEKCDKYVNSIRQANMKKNNSNGNGSSRNNNLEDYPSFAHVCYPECIYRETGSLVDGQIVMANVRKFLQSNVNRRDKDIVPHIIQSFETCLSNIGSHLEAAGLRMYPKLAEGCSPYASMVYGCVNAQTFLHCPAQMWRNERSCNLAKSFAEQCNPLPHVPLPIV